MSTAGEIVYSIPTDGTSAPEGPLDLSFVSYFNVRSFGATGLGTVSDQSSVQRTINAAGAATYPGTVFFPAGIYLCPSLMVPYGVTLLGEGEGQSLIISDSATSDILTISSPLAYGAKVRHLTFGASTARTTGRAIVINGGDHICSWVLVEHVTILDHAKSIAIENAAWTRINEVTFTSSVANSIGVRINDFINPDAGENSCTDCHFNISGSSSTHILWETGAGLRLSGNKFLNGARAVEATIVAGTQFTANGNMFDGQAAAAIYFHNSDVTTQFTDIAITGNNFAGTSTLGHIVMDGFHNWSYGRIAISGNTGAQVASGSYGVYLKNCAAVAIGPNAFGGPGGSTGIYLDSSVSYGIVSSNMIVGYGTSIDNQTSGPTGVKVIGYDFNSGRMYIPTTLHAVLPTSASGLSSGDWWNNGGIPNIVA